MTSPPVTGCSLAEFGRQTALECERSHQRQRELISRPHPGISPIRQGGSRINETPSRWKSASSRSLLHKARGHHSTRKRTP